MTRDSVTTWSSVHIFEINDFDWEMSTVSHTDTERNEGIVRPWLECDDAACRDDLHREGLNYIVCITISCR